MPTIAMSALDLTLIPRSHPEELNQIAVVDRLNRMEKRLEKMVDTLDGVMCENVNLKEQMSLITQKQPTYATVASSPIQQSSNGIHISRDSRDSRVIPPQRFTELPPPRSDYIMPTPQLSQMPSHRRRARSPDNVSMRSTATDVSGYHKQPHQRKEEKRRVRKVVIGNKSTADGASSIRFKGAPEPERSLFIYRVTGDTHIDDIHDMLSQYKFTVLSLECVSHPESKYKSFNLTVPISQFNSLYNEELWPHGVRVRRYNAPRTDKHVS